MKKNTKKKGSGTEKRAIDILVRMGYVIERARPVYVYRDGRPRSTAVDFFSLIDIVAKNQAFRTLWLQVKSDESDAYRACKAIRDSNLFNPLFDDVQVWEWLGSTRPGQPGRFLARRLDDEFKTNRDWTFDTNTTRFPWWGDNDGPRSESQTSAQPLF